MYIRKPTAFNKYSLYINLRYRCDCIPKVSMPSPKGHLYWTPPHFIPSIYKAKALGNTNTPGTDILNPATLNHSMLKYTYFWLKNKTEFWSVPVLVKNNYVYLWIWNNVSWAYSKMSLSTIDCFMCY